MVEKLLSATMRLNRDREDQYNLVRERLCFYLDLHDKSAARNLSRRIEILGLQQEVFLTERVKYIVRDSPVSAQQREGRRWVPRDSPRSRADAMLQRVQPDTDHKQPLLSHKYKTLTIAEAIIILDDIYEKFFKSTVKPKVKVFKKHYIKIEFLDKAHRPVYKEFDVWPKISLDPDPVSPKAPEDTTSKESEKLPEKHQYNSRNRKMTRKSRPRIKEPEDKGGFCEICNCPYNDAVLHRRSPQHLAFVKDHNNFLALDSLINAGADVASFLDKAASMNGERRSLRNICNGDAEPKNKRSKHSQSPDSTLNGDVSPKRNGQVDDDRKHNTRCSKRISESQVSEDRQYYKVVDVSTKLRSSGGFATKKKESSLTCNGTKPLVVKFRKIRKSELSVLSDEAEQFMFPKRAGSTSSDSSNEEEEKESKRLPQPSPALERRRQARPLALKEESSEEDSWPESGGRRRRVPAAVRRQRPPPPAEPAPASTPAPAPADNERVPTPPPEEVSPLREQTERCMKWEDGRLRYTAAVEQLEFAFESVPHSEPWFETFKRQDEDKNVTKNLPQYFSLFSTKTPKLPYEVGQLPPLKPNCCPLSDLIKREEKPGPSRSYGTRGMKKQKFKKRQSAVQALIASEAHPRKSPREHASTLAILGSAGLLHRRRRGDSTTASEDAASDSLGAPRTAAAEVDARAASERLRQFLAEVFEDAAEYDLGEEVMQAEPIAATSGAAPDLLHLVSGFDSCDMIRAELSAHSHPEPEPDPEPAPTPAARAGPGPRARRRGRFKKKNRTGWPAKKKQRKGDSGPDSPEGKTESSLDRSSAEPPDDAPGSATASELDDHALTEDDIPLKQLPNDDTTLDSQCSSADADATLTADEVEPDHSEDKPEEVVTASPEEKTESKVSKPEEAKRTSRSSVSENEEEKSRSKRKRTAVTAAALGEWLQPVVRVARVDPGAARRLRSAGKPRPARFR